jgi:MerR family transcriptional regulator, heat shock protein HspR
MVMEKSNGVYIMRVASMLTGMHPQTLRKYERAGLLEPSRCKKLRMYSEDDIARLRMIKYLVEDVGLNLAGVKIALKLQSAVMDVKKQLEVNSINEKKRKRLLTTLDEALEILGAMLLPEDNGFSFASTQGKN